MRNRLLLVAVPLCVVMLVAGVAVASPNGGEHFKDTKLDDPHEVRPIAALARISGPTGLDTMTIIEQYLADLAAATAPPATLALSPEPVPEPGIQSEQASAPVWRAAPPETAASTPSTGDFFSCIRQRESGGDYRVVSRDGLYHGAYQFLPSTWNSIASAVGRDDLVGVDPAAASPGDQDAMAHALYEQQGSRPWGGYCG